MTISNTARKAGPFPGNGVATAFAFDFKVFQASDLLVVLTDASGNDATQTLSSQYTVALNANQDANPGGTVTMLTPPDSTHTLTIGSQIPYTQPMVLTNTGGFYPTVLNDAADREVALIQQLLEAQSRTLKVSISTPAGVSTSLPSPAANKVISWNNAGTALENRDITDFATAVAFTNWQADTFTGDGVTTLFTLTASPVAIGNTDVSIAGVTQVPNIDYTLLGTALTFTTAPPNGTRILVRYGRAGMQSVNAMATESYTATAGQTLFPLTTAYIMGAGALAVYLNGARLTPGEDYTETSTTALTLTVGATLGDRLLVVIGNVVNNATLGASAVGFTAAGTGAVATDVQTALRRMRVNCADFGNDLAVAVSAIGSAKTLLVVNSAVNVTADLTVPSNIELRVEGQGLITVTAGKRLYISGTFSAPRLHNCFSAPLLSTTVTASVSGLTLVVTAVSNSVLASGQVVTGGGLPPGVTIAQTAGGGIGTYTLNGDWGTIASTTFTVTGASVIFGAGAAECVYPQWFGAVADSGTTDNTSAVRHAVYSQPWGGRVRIPAGNYKVTDSTVLHGGITIEGDGVVNIANGSPPPNETAVPSHIWTGTDNTSIWVVPVRGDRITIRNLSHGAAASTSGTAPIGTARWGILFNGRAPQFVYGPVIDNCYFYNLDRGILVNDSYAAGATNWGVNPGTVRNCHFLYCSYGILFYTDNADAWKIDQCVFILAANSSGVHLVRCGFLKLDTCFAYGGSAVFSEFIKIAPTETGNPIDTVTIDNCQAESCAHFLTYAGSNTRSFDINLRNCITQMGADIYLGNICQFNSINTHLMAFVYYNHASVRINSINDWFEFQNFVSGTTWDYINAGAGSAQAIQTYIPGAFPSSGLGVNARFNASAIKSAPNVQAVDMYNVTPNDVAVAINRAATTTVVLPTPSLCSGRRIRVVTRQAFAVLSSQSNIVPITGGAATNAILPATAGKWVDLESDGTYWVVTAGN